MQLGKYELHEEIGKGGFGTVYRATDQLLDRVVALKVLHPELLVDHDYIDRFRQEARLAAHLEHPHIVPIYDLADQDGRILLAMKFMSGGSLKKNIASGKLEYNLAFRVLQQVASALEYAHQQNVIHRDVKPGNILWEDNENVRLSDFGFAKALSGAKSVVATRTGILIGTPSYMAPEVWRNKPTSPATDVYSLACVFFEMLTGESLFNGESSAEIMTKHLLDGPQFPAAWPAGVPAGFQAVLQKALERDPAQRISTCQGLVQVLDSLLARPEAAKESPLSRTTHGKKPSRPSHSGSAKVNKSLSPPPAAKESPRNTQVIPLSDEVVMEFVRVLADKFTMGSPLGYPANEFPQHTVMLDEFWIGKYPVTNAQFKVFIQASDYRMPADWLDAQLPEGKGNYPVTGVNWKDAAAFCQWLAQASGFTINLPTEAMWEKAARGVDARLYPWGNQLPDQNLANFAEFKSGTSEVGQFPAGASPYGALDMAGNVWEWVEDWFKSDYYRTSPRANPPGPAGGVKRVLRGGSWNNHASYLRTATRGRRYPDLRLSTFGFRCALVEKKDYPKIRY